MQKRAPILPALSLLSALLVGCNSTVQEPRVTYAVVLTALSSVELNVVPGPNWTPNGETVYALANSSSGSHQVGQTTLDANGHVLFQLPDEAALGAGLTTVDTARVSPGPGNCAVIRPATGSGYSVPSFRTASLVFSAKTTSSSYRLLQDVGLNSGFNSRLIYVDRDVSADVTVRCTSATRTDDTTYDFNLPKGWSLATVSETASGSVFTHKLVAGAATFPIARLTLTGSIETQAPTP